MGNRKRSWVTMSPDRLMARFSEELPKARIQSIEVDKYGFMCIRFRTGDRIDQFTKPVASVREWESTIANWRVVSGAERTEVA